MPMTQPFIRIEFAEKDVVRFKKDLEVWKQLHEELATDCWFWENMAEKTNCLFLQITRSDRDIRKLAEKCNIADGHELYVRNRHVLIAWLEFAVGLCREMEWLEGEYGAVSGAGVLREHVELAERTLHMPRPVTIDETTGEIIEADGKPFLFAGVTRQELLKALDEERSGRMTSLKEIKAARAGQTV